MADFRKWFYALAMVALVIGLTVPASAQSSAVTCNTNASVPTLARAEGYTELVGDYVLVCTGGTPTAPAQVVPQVNVSVFLTTNITSRLTTSTGNYNEALLIIDEPNTPANPTKPILNCGNAGANDQGVSGPGVCSITSDGNPVDTYGGIPNVSYDLASATSGTCGTAVPGSSPTRYYGGSSSAGDIYGCGRPNIFQGRTGLSQNSGQNNIVVFSGVPFDPPGTTTTRTLRITNVRANANGVGIASTFALSEIQMNVSFTGTTFVAVNNPQQIVAYVQRGLLVAGNAVLGAGYATGVNMGFLQCNSENPGLTNGHAGYYGAPYISSSSGNVPVPQPYTSGPYSDFTQPFVRLQEGFNTAWKYKNISFLASPTGNGSFVNGGYVYNGNINYPADYAQNVPGANYNTESGFEWEPANTIPTPDPPNSVGTSPVASNGLPLFSAYTGTGISTAGAVSQGTRLALSFGNVPQGASIWVPPVVYLYRQNLSIGSVCGYYANGMPACSLTGAGATGVMVLVSTDSAGDTGFQFAWTGNSYLQQVPSSNLAVWEVLWSDPNSLEQVDVPVVVSYISNLTANPPVGLPVPGTPTTATAGFAPFYSTGAAAAPSYSLPVPRFATSALSPQTLFEIIRCACDLLFPYVASAGGFDTGLAIANTSLDPGATYGFHATPQQGAVTFWYFGTVVGGGSTPGSQTSNIVPAGGVLTYVLSNGGGAINSSAGSTATGLSGVPGLVGYIIVQTGFQYCHAYAYISALGAGPTGNGISEGYLGIVLDSPVNGVLPRTTQAAENDAH